MRQLAQRMSCVVPSATLAITNKARQMGRAGLDVVSLAAGEPNFGTPDFIVEAMVEAARGGATRYASAAGIPELRAAVAQEFSEHYGVPFEADQTIVTVGAKQALFNAFQALMDDGSEVIVPTPCWLSYPTQARLAGGVVVAVPTSFESGFALDPEALRKAVTKRTRGIVINSPNNPTGAVYDAEALSAVGDLAKERDLWVLCDDIYSYIHYGAEQPPSLLRLRPDLRERVLVVHGVSKTFCMTGWRIGFAGGPADFIRRLAHLQSQQTSNATTFAQHGAVAALASDRSFLAGWLEEFGRRRRRIVELINGLDPLGAVRCHLPGGAFYVLADISGLLSRLHHGEPIGTDYRFARLLLEEACVAVVPGEPFGAPGFVRFTYTSSLEDIERGLERVARFIEGLDA